MDFGNFVRALVDMDLSKDLSYKISVERVGIAFFVEIEYERLPTYHNFFKCIKHNLEECKRRTCIE